TSRHNLFTVSQIFGRLRFEDPELLAILGGKQVMIESPLIKEILAESKQDDILTVLKARFGEVPLELAKRLRRISSEKKLEKLIEEAARCASLKAFREQLQSR